MNVNFNKKQLRQVLFFIGIIKKESNLEKARVVRNNSGNWFHIKNDILNKFNIYILQLHKKNKEICKFCTIDFFLKIEYNNNVSFAHII